MAHQVSLNIQAAPGYAYVNFKGSTYKFQITGAEGNITGLRDWSEFVLKNLEALESFQTANVKSKTNEDFEFTKIKSAQMVLQANSEIKFSDPSKAKDLPDVSIASVKYDDRITDAPTKEIAIEQNTFATIQNKITEIGTALRTYKAPYTPPQPPASGQPPQPQGSPLPAIPTAPQKEAHTPLTSDQLLSDYLNKQSVGAASNAPDVIISQFNGMQNPVATTEKQLKKDVADYIRHNTDTIVNDTADLQQMFDTLKPVFQDQNVSDATFKQMFPNAKENKKNHHLTTIQEFLANRESAARLDPKEKRMLVKAFADYIETLNPADKTCPFVFFKMAHAVMSSDTKGGLLRKTTYTKKPLNYGLVIVEKNAQGTYEIKGRWPQSGTLNPKHTAFIMHNPSGIQKYQGFDRAQINSSANDPSVSAQALPQGSPKPNYYPLAFSFDVGGSGDCAAFALQDAIFQQDKTYYTTKIQWESELKGQRIDLRHNTMEYIRANPQQFRADEYFCQFIDAFSEAIVKDPRGIESLGNLQAEKIKELNQKSKNGPDLTEAEKDWLIQIYAVYARKSGVYLDKPFFLAHALQKGKKIAVLDSNKKVIYTAPIPSAEMKKDDYLFVYYDGINHYHSINREHVELQTAIDAYNAGHKHHLARSEFFNLAQKQDLTINELHDGLGKLKRDDLQGYMYLYETASSLVQAIEANDNNTISIFKALSQSNHIQEISKRTALEARAAFFNALNANPKDQGVINARLQEMRVKDEHGWLAVGACVWERAGSPNNSGVDWGQNQVFNNHANAPTLEAVLSKILATEINNQGTLSLL